MIFPGYEIEVVVGCGFGEKRGKCCSYGSSIPREVELTASGGSWDFGARVWACSTKMQARPTPIEQGQG